MTRNELDPRRMEYAELISQSPFFQALGPYQEQIMKSTWIKTATKSKSSENPTPFVKEGDPADYLHVVLSGHIFNQKNIFNGALKGMYIASSVRAPHVFGFESVLAAMRGEKTEYRNQATALSKSIVAQVDARPLAEIINLETDYLVNTKEKQPNPFYMYFIEEMKRAYDCMHAANIDRVFMNKSLEQQVAQLILNLTSLFGEEIPVPKPILAQMLGTYRETVSEHIKSLREQGILGPNVRKLRIINEEALRAIIEE